MKTAIFLVTIFVFSMIWSMVIINYLPDAATANKRDKTRYSEKQRLIILETLSRTCTWFIYFLVISILTRYLGPSNTNFDLISKYPLNHGLNCLDYTWGFELFVF
ncbi:hypothetical protein JZH61_07795 [Staphylococcus saprophyticus]|uniref:hypothetical protein n=1 Tax=Staphylococcus saprophyticus TaxID=29385 RepID=UPI0019D200FD|nr:hypothetical protein [Staphylococcus saprophyticus]MBN6203731.1 hypothetical protein [Staphylococcus saprophyticus]